MVTTSHVVKRDVPLLSAELARRIERLVAPEPVVSAGPMAPGTVIVVQFGRTIAAKAKGGRPSNKVFCFGPDDLSRLDDILAFYASDALEPEFYLTPIGFTRAVGAALSTAGFAQFDFQQAILYGLPSSELTSPPRHIAIERVTADTLEDYLSTMVHGFEMPPEWRDVLPEVGLSHQQPCPAIVEQVEVVLRAQGGIHRHGHRAELDGAEEGGGEFGRVVEQDGHALL